MTYQIKCDNVYVGETWRSAETRGKEHTKSLNRKEEWFALLKHCRDKHDNKIQKFQMNVTSFYSIRIDRIAKGSLMNSMNEWNYFEIQSAMVMSG